MATKQAERQKLESFRAELGPLEDGQCPLETMGKDEHLARHPLYADCAVQIVAELRGLQERIRSTPWTPRSTAADTARALRGRIATNIDIIGREHSVREG